MNKKLHVVCLGGGIGTVNLIKGLKGHDLEITSVFSMADDGASAGRLRRFFKINPMGDMVNCMAALSSEKDPLVEKLLTYRFPGNRWGGDNEIGGQKLGNLMVVALRDIAGDFNSAIKLLQKLFHIENTFLPATEKAVTISAKTIEGQVIDREENIDLGKYSGKKILEKVYLHPSNAKAPVEVIEAIQNADVIIAGPGDLYTTILPVLIVPEIEKALKESKAKRMFVVNVANKPFETKNYKVSNFVDSIKNHLTSFPFDYVITNNNFSKAIPKKYKYTYVENNGFKSSDGSFEIIEADLLDDEFPLYHSSQKLAKVILSRV